jgi:hypothetical protein
LIFSYWLDKQESRLEERLLDKQVSRRTFDAYLHEKDEAYQNPIG